MATTNASATPFTFSGTSGTKTTNLDNSGNSTCFAVSGTSSPVWFESGVHADGMASILMLAGGHCKKVFFKAARTEDVGPFTNMTARLFVNVGGAGLGTGGTDTAVDLCSFNPGATGGANGAAVCRSATQVDVKKGNLIANCFRASYGVPTNTQIAWSLNCVSKK